MIAIVKAVRPTYLLALTMLSASGPCYAAHDYHADDVLGGPPTSSTAYINRQKVSTTSTVPDKESPGEKETRAKNAALRPFAAKDDSQSMDPVYAALPDCKPMVTKIPHPYVPFHSVTLQVHGLVNGKCKYTQTGFGMSQICLFSPEQRAMLRNYKELLTSMMGDKSTCHLDES